MSDVSVLLVGESWQTLELHIKGFDMFCRGDYSEGIDDLRTALSDSGVETDYQPCHVAATEFPATTEEISRYDTVVLSDIGYDTLAIPPGSFDRFERIPNRLELLDSFVRAGGGLVMIGGYMSFQGIKGSGGYSGTLLEDTLPVSLEPFDDRVECSSGAVPTLEVTDHPIFDGISGEWPHFLGYNRVSCDENADQLLTIDDNPMLVAGTHGEGRSVAFMSDCAPHWGPPAFTEWEHYPDLWTNIVTWAAGET